MDESDADLVKRALAGDRAAFGPLVERHRSILLRLAQLKGDQSGIEDKGEWVSAPLPDMGLPAHRSTKPEK